MSDRFCAHCGAPFSPKAKGQRACSFPCARALVPTVDDEDDENEIPNAKREARLAKGWSPKPLRRPTSYVLAEEARADRSKRIAGALEELRRINASRLRN